MTLEIGGINYLKRPNRFKREQYFCLVPEENEESTIRSGKMKTGYVPSTTNARDGEAIAFYSVYIVKEPGENGTTLYEILFNDYMEMKAAKHPFILDPDGKVYRPEYLKTTEGYAYSKQTYYNARQVSSDRTLNGVFSYLKNHPDHETFLFEEKPNVVKIVNGETVVDEPDTREVVRNLGMMGMIADNAYNIVDNNGANRLELSINRANLNQDKYGECEEFSIVLKEATECELTEGTTAGIFELNIPYAMTSSVDVVKNARFVAVNRPTRPYHISPTHGATDVEFNPTLDWTDSPEAEQYRIYFGTQSGNLTTIATAAISEYATDGLAKATTYFWQIEAVDELGITNMSTESSFTTKDSPFPGGDGSEGDPYQIENWEQLAAMNDYLDKSFIQNNTLNSSTGDYETYASLQANSGAGWKPIGNPTTKFTGSYDGNGYKIENLSINRPDEDGVGLFGFVYSGTVTNVTLTEATVTGKRNVGMLVGTANLFGQGIVEFSNASGTVSSKSMNCGGLVGRLEWGEIRESYSGGKVISDDDCVGGLAGINNSGTVNDSYAVSDVHGNRFVGGLVGRNDKGTITNSYASGSVSSDNGYVGGLVGQNLNDVTIDNSYWDKETTGQATSAGVSDTFGKTTAEMRDKDTFTGWDFDNTWTIVEEGAYVSYPYLRNNAQDPRPEYGDGRFTGGDGSEENPFKIETWSGIAAIDDYLDKYFILNKDIDSTTIDYDTYASATSNSGKGWMERIGNSSPYFTGQFDGNGKKIKDFNIRYGGALFATLGEGAVIKNLGMEDVSLQGGFEMAAIAINNYKGTIEQCYVTGVIDPDASKAAAIAVFNKKFIKDCYTTATVVNTGSETGGIVSQNTSVGTIERCYVAGSVQGDGEVGAICGNNFSFSGTYGSDCYWDTETTGQTKAYNDGPTDGGTSTVNMKKQATFENWDFMNVWAIDEDTSYPYLRNNIESPHPAP